MSAKSCYRQGDVLFVPIEVLPDGERRVRENGTVAHGELTGHSHTLAKTDCECAEVLEIGNAVYVRVFGNDEHRDEVRFEHEEHLPITLPPGNYEVRIQREYTPEELRNVAD